MNKTFKQGEEAIYGPNHVIITGAESAFGVNTYFIMYADGTMKEIEVDDKSLKKIEPVIIHSEFNQILLKLWEGDKNSHCIDYF